MTKMRNNASIFAQRGDAWVTSREGREKFGRNLESENPDLDQHLFAKKVKSNPRNEIAGVAIIETKPKDKEPDARRLKANVMIRVNKAINKSRNASHVRKCIEEERRHRLSNDGNDSK